MARPRIHTDQAAKQRAYRARAKARVAADTPTPAPDRWPALWALWEATRRARKAQRVLTAALDGERQTTPDSTLAGDLAHDCARLAAIVDDLQYASEQLYRHTPLTLRRSTRNNRDEVDPRRLREALVIRQFAPELVEGIARGESFSAAYHIARERQRDHEAFGRVLEWFQEQGEEADTPQASDAS
jgi:hypothetical protein